MRHQDFSAVFEIARDAAAFAAVERIEAGDTIGLGSGRAVWRTIQLIHERFGDHPPIRAAFASDATRHLGESVGIEPVELDGTVRLSMAIDGADEIGPNLELIKGGGAALLREKIVISAADRFVVVADVHKRVDRLGSTRVLPIEVVRFAWPETRRRVLDLLPVADLRTAHNGDPVVTDEGHYLLDTEIPEGTDLPALATAIKGTVGVVEHGLFLGMAHEVLLGDDEGGVEVLTP
jgi:ribose 5-phosphate isomerase A